MGHDSKRGHDLPALARGTDQAITSAINQHVQAEQRGEDEDGQAGAIAPVG